MLDKRYGLKYSMPHSVVHIIDNSMYNGELPTIVTDDPSIYSTIVVTGSDMGVDNEIINVTRSDVLNVAFNMGNPTAPEINKYGQTITYPADLINQNVPVKLLRVTPEGSTYAFVCLLIQWTIEDNTLRIRYKTSDEVTANGVPAGKILTNFKNPKRLHDAFINGIDKTITEEDGTVWQQRVFMTFISAGRGSAYNKYNVTINPVQQTRRPANIKYMFTTLNTIDGTTVEKFFASLFNENNDMRPDASEPLNVVVGQRVAGSSIMIPTLNESCVRELYNIYMELLKSNIDNKIYENYVISDRTYYSDVYSKTTLNIFDPVFGRYIYNGDSDVKLPFMQIEMASLDVPRLDDGSIIYDSLGLPETATDYQKAEAYRAKITHPTKIFDVILGNENENVLYGVNNPDDMYHVGDMFMPDLISNTLYMITTINQYSGAVSTIPIYQVHYTDDTTQRTYKEPFKFSIDVRDVANPTDDVGVFKAAITKAVDELLSKRRYEPTMTTTTGAGGTIKYKEDYILVQYSITDGNGEKQFCIAKISYSNSGTTVETLKSTCEEVYTTAQEIYPIIVFPSTTVTSFAYKSNDFYYNKLGSTVIDVDHGKVYVNLYDINNTSLISSDYVKVEVRTNSSPFKAGFAVPQKIQTKEDLTGKQLDFVLYAEASYKFKQPTIRIDIDEPTADNARKFGYVVGQETFLSEYQSVRFNVKQVEYATQINPNTGAIEYWCIGGPRGIQTVPADNSGFSYNIALVKTIILEPQNTFERIIPEGTYTLDNQNYSRNIFLEPAFNSNEWYYYVSQIDEYKQWTTVPSSQEEWARVYQTLYTKHQTEDPETHEITTTYVQNTSPAPIFSNLPANQAYCKLDSVNDTFVELTTEPEDWATKYWTYYVRTNGIAGSMISIKITERDITTVGIKEPYGITRYDIIGPVGSIYSYSINKNSIPANYYIGEYGSNPTSEAGGIPIGHGSTGFFDEDIDPIVFKWKYSELLVKAYKGMIDPRILSPTRCPAKYLFDGGTNTIIGQTILPYMTYSPSDIILASTIFTDEEKDAIQINEELISREIQAYDQTIGIDVKQAMYDLMIQRCYYGMPEDKRPIGPGSGLSLHLDAGVTSATTSLLMNTSFIKRFSNPNASWDIGGYTSINDGVTYTYVKRLVQNMFTHMRQYTINKPFVGKYTDIKSTEYTSFYPDIDTTDWELRELYYNSGGNAWIMDVNGNLQRKSQRSLYREGDTSDLIQENNMRTLSLLVYLLQNKIDTYLLEYNDDGVLKTLKEDVDNMFTNWVGNLVEALDIRFERDINPYDGGDIVVCYCNVVFRGLILRVPIIVNVNRRSST